MFRRTSFCCSVCRGGDEEIRVVVLRHKGLVCHPHKGDRKAHIPADQLVDSVNGGLGVPDRTPHGSYRSGSSTELCIECVGSRNHTEDGSNKDEMLCTFLAMDRVGLGDTLV